MATENLATTDLPAIPAKRYFTIGEVSELCGVKPHVLRYWEQEFTQLKPVKRRGNRRDRKSTRLNSSHTVISYAVFCLKKKKRKNQEETPGAQPSTQRYSRSR